MKKFYDKTNFNNPELPVFAIFKIENSKKYFLLELEGTYQKWQATKYSDLVVLKFTKADAIDKIKFMKKNPAKYSGFMDYGIVDNEGKQQSFEFGFNIQEKEQHIFKFDDFVNEK